MSKKMLQNQNNKPTPEEISKVQSYLAEQEEKNGMFIAEEDIKSLADYLVIMSELATKISTSISANRISYQLPDLMESLKLREKEVEKILNKYLFGGDNG